jgi:hypothetical protein
MSWFSKKNRTAKPLWAPTPEIRWRTTHTHGDWLYQVKERLYVDFSGPNEQWKRIRICAGPVERVVHCSSVPLDP